MKRVTQVSETHGYRETFEAAGHEVTLYDADAFRRAKSHARFVTGRDGQRKRITDQKAAIITTSGMLGTEDPLAVAG